MRFNLKFTHGVGKCSLKHSYNLATFRTLISWPGRLPLIMPEGNLKTLPINLINTSTQ